MGHVFCGAAAAPARTGRVLACQTTSRATERVRQRKLGMTSSPVAGSRAIHPQPGSCSTVRTRRLVFSVVGIAGLEAVQEMSGTAQDAVQSSVEVTAHLARILAVDAHEDRVWGSLERGVAQRFRLRKTGRHRQDEMLSVGLRTL